MPVFPINKLSEIDFAVTRIADAFYAKTFLVLGPDEFTDAFINPDHMGLLRETQSLIGNVGSQACSTKIAPTGTEFQLEAEVHFYGHPPVPLPLYIREGMQRTCPEETSTKVREWAADRARFGMAFGTVRLALAHLSEICVDARAMALCLPCLPQLMAHTSENEDSVMVKRAQRLAQRTAVPKLPRLAPALKVVLHEASAMVQAAAMSASAPDITLKRGQCRVRVTGAGNFPVPDHIAGSPDGGLFY